MAYASTVWLGSVAALCPSQDTAGDGTTTLTDFAGVSNGVATNMATIANNWVTDDAKRCLEVDGVNDYVITDATPAGGAKKISFAAKFCRLATTGSGACFCIANSLTGTVGRFNVFHFSDGNFYVQFDGSNFGYWAQSLTDLAWHSLVVLWDGTATGNSNRLKVWLDGAAKTLIFTGTIPSQLSTITAGRLAIGVTNGNSSAVYGRSRMDDVRVNVRLWSDAERAEIDASRGGTYATSSGGASQLINGGLVRGQVL